MTDQARLETLGATIAALRARVVSSTAFGVRVSRRSSDVSELSELRQLARDFAGPHLNDHWLAGKCAACNAERQLRAIGERLRRTA